MKKSFMPILLFLSFSLLAQEVITFDIGDWEPYTSSRDPDSQVLEFLVKEIFALYDMDVEFRYYPWLRSLRNVENGSSAGSFPLMRTGEREVNRLSSQEPILVEENVFFHLKNLDFDWSDFSDLEGYRIGGTIGYGYMAPLAQYGLNIEEVPKEDLNFKEIAVGHIEIYPASKNVGNYLLVSRKKNRAQEIIDKFDEGIRFLRKNGRYSEITDLLPHIP
jgi:polar amino acid transport system substrate-binding protein